MTDTLADCNAKRHGDMSAYSFWKCRCPEAKEAWRIYKKRIREGRHTPAMIPAVGTARRLQALVAAGYTWKHLADYLGFTKNRAAYLGMTTEGQVYRETADRVAKLYDRLSLTPGPSSYARTVAVRHGFRPPLAWDDEALDDPNGKPYDDDQDNGTPVVDGEAVRRALAGERLRLTPIERHHAVHRGVAAGMPLSAITRALHISYAQGRELAEQPLPDYELAA
jgi:hypothetical protein